MEKDGSGASQRDPFADPSALLREGDPADIAERTGVPFRDGAFRLSFLRWELSVTHPELAFGAPRFLDTYVVRLLAFLYLAKARAGPLASRWIPYRELKDGLFYSKSFAETVEEKLCRRFGEDLEGMAAACEALGGRRVDQGDLGLVLNTLPRLPLLIIAWKGDEEFPPNLRILFDASATDYLNAFELRMLCGEVSSRIIAVADGRLELPPPEE
ncbi:MAG: DUF3786 domain-containing protein [Actinomycetota bacterium]|nr:DUF3786 domain-containing protein [Actinomycetota bacterium]